MTETPIGSRDLSAEGSSPHPAFSIICLSSQDWRTALPTNRQQIMLRAARRGHRVLFVETSYFLGRHVWSIIRRPARKSLLRRLLRTEEVGPGIRVRRALNVLPWGFTYRIPNALNWRVTALVLRRLARTLPQPVVLWLYDPTAARAVGSCGEAFAVYDCVDDYAEQTTSARKRAFVVASDRLAARRCRLVFASSRTMFERQRQANPATHLVPNAGDYEHFRDAADRATAHPEVASLSRPILGFAGNFLASKVDLSLLEHVALTRPSWTMLLIGPASHETGPALDSLGRHPNVHWLGARPYEALPRYVAAFDVGLIPYVSNAYTRSCFPLKLFEYLAAGKPVVASGLPELDGMEPDVVLATSPSRFVEAVEEAIGCDTESDRLRRMRVAAQNSWEKRAERLLTLVQAELAG